MKPKSSFRRYGAALAAVLILTGTGTTASKADEFMEELIVEEESADSGIDGASNGNGAAYRMGDGFILEQTVVENPDAENNVSSKKAGSSAVVSSAKPEAAPYVSGAGADAGKRGAAAGANTGSPLTEGMSETTADTGRPTGSVREPETVIPTESEIQLQGTMLPSDSQTQTHETLLPSQSQESETGLPSQSQGPETMGPSQSQEPEIILPSKPQEPESGLPGKSQTTEPTAPNEPQSESGPPANTAQKIYLGIDNRNLYDGMEQSFSDGYQPLIENQTVLLTVPFTASGKLRNDRLTVDLIFSEKENSPFVFRNYQRDIEKKQYIPAGERMVSLPVSVQEQDNDRSIREIYLYTCRIPLQESAAPGQYSVTVRACGYTEQAEQVTLEYQIFVRIPEPELPDNAAAEQSGGFPGESYSGGGGGGGGGEAAEELIRQPKMLLETCSLFDRTLDAGSREKLTVSFQNRSMAQPMYNLKIVVSSDPAVLQPGRNSFYFAKVDPGETIFLEDELCIAADAAEGAAALTYDFEYEDKKGTAASGRETVALTVAQPVRMELECSDFPSFVYASDTLELSVQALNLSRTTVYNARVHLEGSGIFPNEDLFFGNLEAGTSGSGMLRAYIGTLTMDAIGSDPGTNDTEKYGASEGTITLAYEDRNGETHEITRPWQTEIKKAQILSLKTETEEQEANSWWLSIYAVLLLGLCALVLMLLARLHRKNLLLKEASQR